MVKGFGNSKEKKFRGDSRDFFAEKESILKKELESQFRPAVITPYLKEDIKIIERCHKSCLSQSYKASHFFIADGYPNESINNWDVNHIILSKSHNDYGNTPRGIGALSAINQGFNVIFFLDADNWFENSHIESILKMKSQMLSLDIIASYRNLILPNGTYVESDKEDSDKRHIDTSCMTFFESSFFLLPFWITMTRELSVLCDRVMFKMFKENNLKVGFTKQQTLNYSTNYKVHYLRAGIDPPKESKELYLSDLKNFSQNKFYSRNRFNFDMPDFLANL